MYKDCEEKKKKGNNRKTSFIHKNHVLTHEVPNNQFLHHHQQYHEILFH